jgi:phosphatidate cytidylyltransferase
MDVKFRGKKDKKKEVKVQPEEKIKPTSKPKSNFVVRTIYTLLMLFGFFMVIAAGPLYSVMFIIMISILLFKELVNLKLREDKEKEIPFFRLINWYFFAITLYYQLGFLIKSKLPHLIFLDENIHTLIKYHNVVFFMLWSFGFVAFTLSLKPGFYKY